MDIFWGNLPWITLNVSLAILGMFFGILFYLTRNFFRFIFFILWILFLPNTIYLITDIQYLPDQIVKVEFLSQIMLAGQYFGLILLGIITFLLGFYPFEKFLAKSAGKATSSSIIFLINYLIAFGVMLGKIYRVHSWFVLTDPQQVLTGSLDLLNSQQTLAAIILFGTLGNIIYFVIARKLGFRIWTERFYRNITQ